MADIFDEVSEELREDQMLKFWKTPKLPAIPSRQNFHTTYLTHL